MSKEFISIACITGNEYEWKKTKVQTMHVNDGPI
jgi:hypothetical protein